MGLLVGLGIAVIALIAIAGGKKELGTKKAYQILIQTPAPIPASEAMIANQLGLGPDDLISMSSPAMGQLIVRGRFETQFTSPPDVGQTINFFGVPGTVMQVAPIPNA